MADIAAQKARPQYRNIHVTQILHYRLPPPGIVSILHRISGSLLFLVGIPFVLYLFQQSLTSEISFQSYRAIVGSVPGKLVLLAIIWAYVHHTVAGIRYLLLDRHVGIQKFAASKSATAVLAITVLITLVIALKLFGAF
ncbi:MAG TPA: succinate dehydrogenase, cytochrome b556 subunit [Burkholderiaceae bacterium]|nr:succinate dehydrogenase, cytochrome b556 subunit [Burkholderiaceae bacterium]